MKQPFCAGDDDEPGDFVGDEIGGADGGVVSVGDDEGFGLAVADGEPAELDDGVGAAVGTDDCDALLGAGGCVGACDDGELLGRVDAEEGSAEGGGVCRPVLRASWMSTSA